MSGMPSGTRAILGPLYDAWEDFDRVLAGLVREDAMRSDYGSAIAWTAGHCANQVDSLINVRLAALAPHPLVSQQRFRVGGAGTALEWEELLAATQQVRTAARRYLAKLTAAELERRIPYEGSMTFVRERGLSPSYAVARVVAHHYFHAGEIAVVRSMMGQAAGDYPGQMRWSLGD